MNIDQEQPTSTVTKTKTPAQDAPAPPAVVAAKETPAPPAAAVTPAPAAKPTTAVGRVEQTIHDLVAEAEKVYAGAKAVLDRAKLDAEHKLAMLDHLLGRRDREVGGNSAKEIRDHLKRQSDRVVQLTTPPATTGG